MILTCQFCGLEDLAESDSFELDKNDIGFWCTDCDGFSYINCNFNKHKFTLILEDKNAEKPIQSDHRIKLNKRISPYRYPGGKSKIIDYLYIHMQESKSKKLISPFTGGGSFELAMLEAGVVKQLHLNDLDTGVFSLWWVIKHMPFALLERLDSISPNHKDFFSAREIINSDYKNVDVVDAAWASLLVNRLAYSGICKANPLGGKKGNQNMLLSRWNPNELKRRIKNIHLMSDRIEITQENAVDLIEEAYWNNDATIFIDPPFVKKGRALYHCYFDENDHMDLAFLLDSLHSGCPGADILLTYDYTEWLDTLYDYPERSVIGRTYSA